jgi:hypothetical protein
MKEIKEIAIVFMVFVAPITGGVVLALNGHWLLAIILFILVLSVRLEMK